MTMNTQRLSDPTEDEIQKQAYLLYLASGCVPGRDLENWLTAKELLRHRHGRSISHSRGPKPRDLHFPPNAQVQRDPNDRTYPPFNHN